MATDYNKILLDKGYTQAQIDAMRNAASSGGSQQDIVNAGKSQPTQTTSSSVKQSSDQRTQEVMNRANQTQSTLNSMSQSVAQNNSRNAQVGTGDVAGMQQNQTKSTPTTTPGATGTPISQDTVAKSWDSLSATQQKNALSRNKALNDYITSRGLTVKKEETPVTTTKSTPKQTTAQTPKQQQWDYQDNSQARMDEMARNLNGFRQTNPELFQDESMFYNFFIDGKGRSQDQIDFLWDYFNRVKKFGKYDNMSPDALGTGIANGTVPEDYLNNLKATDPAKYQEVVAFKQEREDTIKNESFLNDAANMAGIEGWESEPSSIQYGKWNGIWMDEDENGVDDRREHYATEEEQGYQRQIADLNAANLDIDNTVKHDYEDLVKRYPGATKATLMAMANDRNANLLREKENNLVELTRLQGYVSYMQSERQEMNQAGADSIAQLQKNLQMFYQYSPEGLAELAQAQYGATNITLDQADSGTETQKQMALQNVLDGYYAKYGDIIQRSEQQVINDVIAYAKKNGIGLAQALQENFVQPLQSKPEFATLSSGKSITSTPTDKWAKLSDNMLYNTVTGEIRDVNGDVISQGTYAAPGTKVTNASGKSYTVVTEEQLITGLDGFLADKNIGDKGGQCGAFVNNGLKAIGAISENIYDNSKESKLNSKNEDVDTTAQTGWVAIRNPDKLSGNGAKYGHIGFVVQDNGDGTVKVLDSNGTKNAKGEYDETIGVRDVPKSSLYGYFNPTKGTGTGGEGSGDLYYAKVLGWIPIQLRNTNVEKEWYLDIAKEQKEKGLSAFEAAMSIVGFDITNKSPKAQSLKNTILDIIKKQGSDTLFDQAVLSSMASFINDGDYEGALETLENQLGTYMSTKGQTGLGRENMASALQAVKDLDNIKYYQGWLEGGVSSVANALGGEGKKTSDFNSWVSNSKRALRALGYDEEEIADMLPKLTNSKEVFTEKVEALEEAILSQYNIIRKIHGLPAVTSTSMLNDGQLSDLYKVGYVSVEPYQLSNRNYNLMRSITSENEAFASI